MANFNATTGQDNFTGTTLVNDTFTFTVGTANAGDTFDGGLLGLDTDALIVASGNSVDFRAVGNGFTSIERLTLQFNATATFDFTQLNGSVGALPTNLNVIGNAGSVERIIVEMPSAGTISLSAWTFTSWTSGTDTITINGSSGADTITGSSMADTVNAGLGADIVDTGAGNDTINGFAGADSVNGSTGTDTIVLAETSTDLNVATDAQIVAVEAISAAAAAAGVTISLGFQTEGFSVTGSAQNDTITGGAGADTINAGAGNDIINGFVGADSVNGSNGTDTIVLTSTSTSLNGATDAQIAGVETVSAATAAAGVIIILANQTEGFAVTGSVQGDTITGGVGNDTITGGAGSDIINGGGGTDDLALYTGAWINYTISLSEPTYTIVDNRGGAPDGTDTVTNVENFTFSNGTFAAAQILNDAPVAIADTDAVNEDGAVTQSAVTGVLADDTDADSPLGDTKTVSAVNGSAGSVGAAVAGTLGTLTLNADGSYSYVADRADVLAAGVQATDTFNYTVTDARGATSSTTLIITVTAVNDAPVLTGDLTATLAEGASYVLTAADLGFSDPDDAAADVTFTVANLTAGTLRVDGAAATSFTGAQLAAGLVSFQHDGSETTAASFQVTVEDGNEDGSTPTPATFNFTVTAVNDAAGPHRRSHRHRSRKAPAMC